MKSYWRRDVNKTLSSTLEIVLRQVKVLIPQSKILQREYRKRELAVPFSFWSVFILTRYCDYVDGDQREFDLETRVTTNGNSKSPRCFTVVC